MNHPPNEIDYVKALYRKYGDSRGITPETLREGVLVNLSSDFAVISANLEMINEYGWFDTPTMRIMINETTIEIMKLEML